MIQLIAHKDWSKNADASALFLQNMKAVDVSVNPTTILKKTAGQNEKTQESYTKERDLQGLSWGRVIQKGKVLSNDEVVMAEVGGNKSTQSNKENVMCAFLEASTAVELFKKARNMDFRNVAERTFATSSKVLDFTV